MRRFKTLLLATIMFCVGAGVHTRADHILFREIIGKMSVGYDAQKGETLIACYSVAATGPDDLPSEARAAAGSAVKESFQAAMGVFALTPGELSVRLLAALEHFKVTLLEKLSSDALLKHLAERFRLGLFQTIERSSGLRVLVELENPICKVYSELSGKVGGDVGKFMDMMGVVGMPANLRLDLGPFTLPDEVNSLLANIPDPQKLDTYRRDLEKHLAAGTAISAEALQAASDAIGKQVGSLVMQTAKVALFDTVEKGSEEAKKFAEAVSREVQRNIEQANRQLAEAAKSLEKFSRERLAELAANPGGLAAEELNRAKAEVLQQLTYASAGLQTTISMAQRRGEQAVQDVARFSEQLGIQEASQDLVQLSRNLAETAKATQQILDEVTTLRNELATQTVTVLGNATQAARDFIEGLGRMIPAAPSIPPIGEVIKPPNLPPIQVPQFPNLPPAPKIIPGVRLW